jgi:hypothetical protein
MGTLHRRAMGRPTIALLIVLLVVPLLLSRHDHAQHDAQGRPCAACIVAHHLPVVSTVTAAPTPVDVRDHVVQVELRVPTTRLARSPQAGRAPPSRSLVRNA